jgi:hypothetical protein
MKCQEKFQLTVDSIWGGTAYSSDVWIYKLWQTGAYCFSLCVYVSFKSLTCEICVFMQNKQVLTSFPGPVYEKLQKCGLFLNTSSSLKTFPTVHDAVIFAQCNLNKSTDIRVWHMAQQGIAKLTTLKEQFEKWCLKAAENSEVFNSSRKAGVH